MKIRANMSLIQFIVLACLIIITMTLQILTCNGERTRLEETLFTILYFLFSISFAWFLARIVSKDEFLTSQKKFAISAYRRILEIDKSAERLLLRISSKMKAVSKDTYQELEVINAIAAGIRENIKYSIADWADIIGEEIKTFEKIEEINAKQECLLEKTDVQEPLTQSQLKDETKDILSLLESNQKTIDKLISSLPYSLQLTSKDFSTFDERSKINKVVQILFDEKKKKGYLELRGFWDSSFEKDIFESSIGDKLLVSIDDVGGRVGALIARYEQGKSVGVIVNPFPRHYPDCSNLGYHNFLDVIKRFLGKSKFKIEITNIEKEGKPSERHYFKGKIVEDEQVT